MSRPRATPFRMSSAPRATLVLALAIAGIVAGCAKEKPLARGIPPLQSDGSATYGTFVKQNQALLKPNQPIKGVYSVGDAVYVYAGDNQVYALSEGLDIRYLVPVASRYENVRPPVLVGDETIFPTPVSLKVYSSTGALLRSVSLPHPLTSDVRTDPRGLLIAGTAAPTGGRVSVIDPKKAFRPVDQSVLLGSILSAPVSNQGAIYAANDRGSVFAFGPDNRSIWPLEGLKFDTDRPVTADLVADEFALYVASTDTKLYALDRATGHIKWRFMAEVPLVDAPLLTKDRVYQLVPGKGLAAIDKVEGKVYREPAWVASSISKVLSVDDKFVYAIEGRDRLVALGLADGKAKFSVVGQFDFFTAGSDGTIFAATSGGAIVSFKSGQYVGQDIAAAR